MPPVQPTEIKDKKIACEAIERIRKPIPASVYKPHEKKPPAPTRFSVSSESGLSDFLCNWQNIIRTESVLCQTQWRTGSAPNPSA
jgi:hypothetical protein